MNTKRIAQITAGLLIGMLIAVFAYNIQRAGYSETFFAMDTVMTFRVYGAGAKKAVAQAREKVSELENKLSMYRQGSDIQILNDNPRGPVQLQKDTAALLSRAQAYSALSDGRFDITMGEVSALWGIGTGHERVPGDDEIAAALKNTGNLQLMGQSAQTKSLVDLGGIAKGYATDEVRSVLAQLGIQRAVLDLGGNILVMGEKGKGLPWSIGIRDPLDAAGIAGKLQVSDCAIVTSGGYERFFEKDGILYHHILDPKTGKPARSDLLSVTVVSRDGALADAMSTAIYVAGMEEGLSLAKKAGVEAILINHNKEVKTTEGIAKAFHQEGGYTLK